MVTAHLRKVFAELESKSERLRLEMDRIASEKASIDSLRSDWSQAFPADADASDFVGTATAGLVRLSFSLRERFLDYHIAAQASKKTLAPANQIAAELVLERLHRRSSASWVVLID
ncbi:MAG: hypothetical protein AABP62_22065, partial [Planctomycetota bacterium]